jgi:hypothetical protein
MLIPHQKLSESALLGLVREFVTRDGTDYGEREATLERKVADVWASWSGARRPSDFDPATRSGLQSSTARTGRSGR